MAQLRDLLASESSKQGGTGRIDILSWLSRATLDIIGLAGAYIFGVVQQSIFKALFAGFNYKFNALSNEKNELNTAFAQMFKAGQRITLVPVLRGLFPLLRFLVSPNVLSTQHMFNATNSAHED